MKTTMGKWQRCNVEIEYQYVLIVRENRTEMLNEVVIGSAVCMRCISIVVGRCKLT